MINIQIFFIFEVYNMNTKSLITYLCIMVLILTFNTCKKNDSYNEPQVTVYSPEEGSSILVPDTMMISFAIEECDNINNIRVSIDNKELIPMSQKEYIYPEADENSFSVNLFVDAVTESKFKPPYYIHIVIDSDEEYHYYTELKPSIREQLFNGLVVAGKYSVQQTQIRFLDKDFAFDTSIIVNGNMSDFCINNYSSTLFLATALPYKLLNFSLTDKQLMWEKESGIPYPGFNHLANMDNIVYVSTNDCRILGIKPDGTQSFATQQLTDSIPEYFGITDNYILSNINLRNSVDKGYQSYYQGTGIRHMTTEITGDVIGIEGISDNEAVIFSNEVYGGKVTSFAIEYNNVVFEYTTDSINATCRKSDNEIIFITNLGEVMLFETEYHTISRKGIIPGTIKQVTYVNNENFLIITSDNSIIIYSFPSLEAIKSLDEALTNCSTDVIYSY